jgi:pyruvate dehydrogenase E1 component beta subunit/2-oxoisovalerate dehydrogenase E1 component
VTWGAITHQVLEAANRLAAQGVHVTVLETQWLDPFDHDAVHRSLPATGGKLAVVHEANLTGGFGGEVVARALDAGVLSGTHAGSPRPTRVFPPHPSSPPRSSPAPTGSSPNFAT